ncbi:MAG TPA: hypothetical protein VHE80_06135 [Acidimicrobiales bacterium]|nr:hypothetical protein [Acidimicrobiales bacterium]
MAAEQAIRHVEPQPLAAITDIVFPALLHDAVLQHGRRKLAGRWEPGEEQAPKAYGLVGGRRDGTTVTVTLVVPLRNNLRDRGHFKAAMEGLVQQLAVPSETPLDRRGWVADPREVLAAERRCEATGSVLFGAYHMHRVAWSHDPRRDTCTDLDAALAAGSGLWAFILSMVDPERPVLRAFFEGDNEQEAEIHVADEVRPC